MEKVSIFIPITPYTISIAESLIENNINELSLSENILINPHGLEYKKQYWDEVIEDYSSRKVQRNVVKTYLNFFKQIYVFIKIYKRLRKYKKRKIDFYYVDLAHVLSNSVFFSFKSIENRFIIEDGILNYYKLTLKDKMLGRKRVNVFLQLIGLPTKTFAGDITGIEMPEVNKQFVFFPKEAFFPSKSDQIPYTRLEYSLNNKILILGQEPISKFVTEQRYLSSLDIIIQDMIKKLDHFELYYKPHHHGKKELTREFLKAKYKVNFIESNLPIHMFIKEIAPSVVVSFGSTASLNLKLLLPKNVKSYVYLFRDPQLPDNTYIEELFLKIGVLITELN